MNEQTVAGRATAFISHGNLCPGFLLELITMFARKRCISFRIVVSLGLLALSSVASAQTQNPKPAEPDDVVQHVDGLTIAMDRLSATRMEGVTVDYTETDGFRFQHGGEGHSLPLLTIPTLN